MVVFYRTFLTYGKNWTPKEKNKAIDPQLLELVCCERSELILRYAENYNSSVGGESRSKNFFLSVGEKRIESSETIC